MYLAGKPEAARLLQLSIIMQNQVIERLCSFVCYSYTFNEGNQLYQVICKSFDERNIFIIFDLIWQITKQLLKG